MAPHDDIIKGFFPGFFAILSLDLFSVGFCNKTAKSMRITKIMDPKKLNVERSFIAYFAFLIKHASKFRL